MAHAVDLLVDGGFLLDIGVGARDVGLGLVVVVIGDEILHRVVGEERAELAIELRRQGLVGGEDEGGALGLLDHMRHGEGFSRAGDAEQHLVALARLRPRRQLGDGMRLIPLRRIVRDDVQALAALRLFRPRRAVRGERRKNRQVGAQEGEVVTRSRLLARLHEGAPGHRVGAVAQGLGLGPVQLLLLRAHASPAGAGRLRGGGLTGRRAVALAEALEGLGHRDILISLQLLLRGLAKAPLLTVVSHANEYRTQRAAGERRPAVRGMSVVMRVSRCGRRCSRAGRWSPSPWCRCGP